MISPAKRIPVAGRLRPLHRWPPLAPIGISLVLLDLREQLGVTTMQVNLLRCTAISSGLLIVFCAGSLCRRFGARRCLSLSLLFWIAGSLAAILASFGCAFAIPRFGMGRTLVIGPLGCLILPISFILAPVQVPIALIAAVTASFAFSLTVVRVGLTSKVTAMTAKPLLANLEAVRHVLAISTWSLGQQLRPLALPDTLTQTITRWWPAATAGRFCRTATASPGPADAHPGQERRPHD